MKKLYCVLIVLFFASNCFSAEWFPGGKAWDGTYVFGSFFLQRNFRALGFGYTESVAAVTLCACYKELIGDELYSRFPESFPGWWHNIGDRRGGSWRDIGLSLLGSAVLPLPVEIKYNKNFFCLGMQIPVFRPKAGNLHARR